MLKSDEILNTSGMEKKVSVIIPCYNQGKYVAEAINSALNQTYKNIEIVIVNDGSTDDSSEVIKPFAEKYKNILFFDNKENKGVIYARNMAIDACRGVYILPLDADDTIEPTYIEKAVKILDENPKIGIVYCKARKFGTKNKYWALPEFDRSQILYSNCIFVSALFRKSEFIKVGRYKDYMQYGCEDHDLWISFIEQGFDAYRIDEVLFNYRQYGEESRTKLSSDYSNEIWRQIVKNHMDLYFQDENFAEKMHANVKKLKAKHKKYKKLFNILLVVNVFLLLVLSLCILVFKGII